MQEDAYMLGSRGYNNIAVSSSIVEKMAKDPATAESVEKLTEQIKAGTSQPVKVQEEGKGAQLDLTI